MKLNQQLKQVEVKNLNVNNDIVFDYFDKVGKDDYKSLGRALYKTL